MSARSVQPGSYQTLWMFDPWRFYISKTFLELRKASSEICLSLQFKAYGLMGNLWAEAAGEALPHIFSGPHNAEVNLEAITFFGVCARPATPTGMNRCHLVVWYQANIVHPWFVYLPACTRVLLLGSISLLHTSPLHIISAAYLTGIQTSPVHFWYTP